MAFLDQPSKHIRLQSTRSVQGLYARGGKRLFDLSVCLLLLPAIGTAVFLLWLVAKACAPSGFFAHPRVGRNGVLFCC